MNITDILGNLPKQNSDELSSKIAKNAEIRRIKSRNEDFISSVLNFIGDENQYIQRGLSYCDDPARSRLSDEEKKELTKYLVSEVRNLPLRLKAELDRFFNDAEEDKKPEEGVAPEPNVVAAKVFGY